MSAQALTSLPLLPQQGNSGTFQAQGTFTANTQQPQQQCDTCPIPPISQAVYTRSRKVSYGPPTVVAQTVDRCTGVPVSQTEQMNLVFTTTPWTLSANSQVAAVYQPFVPSSFNTA